MSLWDSFRTVPVMTRILQNHCLPSTSWTELAPPWPSGQLQNTQPYPNTCFPGGIWDASTILLILQARVVAPESPSSTYLLDIDRTLWEPEDVDLCGQAQAPEKKDMNLVIVQHRRRKAIRNYGANYVFTLVLTPGFQGTGFQCVWASSFLF